MCKGVESITNQPVSSVLFVWGENCFLSLFQLNFLIVSSEFRLPTLLLFELKEGFVNERKRSWPTARSSKLQVGG